MKLLRFQLLVAFLAFTGLLACTDGSQSAATGKSKIVQQPETVDCATWERNWVRANEPASQLWMEERWTTNKTQITTRINGLLLPADSREEELRDEVIAAIKRADPFDEAFFDLEYTDDIKWHEQELKKALRAQVETCGLDAEALIPKPKTGRPEHME